MRVAKRSLAFFRLYDKNYLSYYVQLLIQLLIRRGRKLYAEKIIFDFLFYIKKKYKCLNFEVFFMNIFKKYKPRVSFVYRKVAAITFSLPWAIRYNRSKNVIIRWFFQAARERSENTFYMRLINEFDDLVKGYGRTIRKSEDYHNLAKKNKPFMKFLRKRKGVFLLRLKKYGAR